jgi:hypothetical protein
MQSPNWPCPNKPAIQLIAARMNLTANFRQNILVLKWLLVGSILISPSRCVDDGLFEQDLGLEGF